MYGVRDIRSIGVLALVLTAVAVGGLSAPCAFAQTAGDLRELPPAEVRVMLERMSGGAVQVAAPQFGIGELAGKPVVPGNGGPGRARSPRLRDVAVGATANDENEPAAAANPVNKKFLVAGSHSFPIGAVNRCVAYRSADNGATWSAPYTMPQLTPASSCSDPVLVYAPDGSRVYYVYMDIKNVQDNTNFPTSYTRTIAYDIVVSFSDDNGKTWSPPLVALAADPYVVTYTPCPFPPGFYCGALTKTGYVFDKNWIGTHVGGVGQADWVYVTATRFDTPGDPHIAFTRSANKGLAWEAYQLLDSGGGTNAVVVQGSRPIGANDNGVLVAWYHSGDDGWLTGRFQIRTKYSDDHGATWRSRVIAVIDEYEAPYWLGPNTFYKRWWGTMFPDVAIDAQGAAHLVYGHDPVENGTCDVDGYVVEGCSPDAEDGDVRYAASARAPYEAWSAPVTVNDDGLHRAQGYAAMTIKSNAVQVIWEDSRTAPDVPQSPIEGCFLVPIEDAVCDSSNVWYDIYGSRKVLGTGVGFFRNFRVTEASSVQDFVFSGDYNDLAANDTTLFGIFTDRRHQTSIFSGRDNVLGSRIIGGGATGK